MLYSWIITSIRITFYTKQHKTRAHIWVAKAIILELIAFLSLHARALSYEIKAISEEERQKARRKQTGRKAAATAVQPAHAWVVGKSNPHAAVAPVSLYVCVYIIYVYYCTAWWLTHLLDFVLANTAACTVALCWRRWWHCLMSKRHANVEEW